MMPDTIMKMLDFFIHPRLTRNSDLLYKARVLVGIIFTYNVILSLSNLYFILLSPLQTYSIIASSCIVVMLQLVWLLSLAMLKRKGNYQPCAQATIASTAVCILAGIILSGGPVSSPFVTLSLVPIIMAFVLVSRNQGLVWAQITLVTHAVLLGVFFSGYQYPQLLDMGHLTIHHGLNWIIAYGAITGLMAVFKTLNQRLAQERDAKHEHLKYLAAHDPLTQLANRSQFDKTLSTALYRANKYDQLVGLLFIDLDNFKPINDEYGHAMGDRVLEVTAKRMQQALRKSDTVARLGGDEFAVIVEHTSQEDEIKRIAQKLRDVIDQDIPGLEVGVRVSSSIGVSVYPEHSRSQQELIMLADQAMYEAKKIKNTWQIYQKDGLSETQS